MARAFCFDLDGTLMDSEVIWVRVVEEFMREADPTVTHADALRIVYGKSWHDTYTGMAQRLNGVAMTLPEMTEMFNVRFRQIASGTGAVIEGSVLLLKRLAQSAPVCIVSGSTREFIAEAVAALGIDGEIAFFLGTEDFSPGKPHPYCYIKAVERLGVPARECVAFEDSAAGLLAARRAGLYCVGLVRPGAPVQDTSQAHCVVSDLGLLDPGDLFRAVAV